MYKPNDEHEESLHDGLEGIVAAETALSRINGQAGELIYAGYRIKDLAGKVNFEEVCYLLWKLRLPNRSELEEVRVALEQEASLPSELIDILKTIPPQAATMDVLRSAVSLLAHYDPDVTDNSEEALFRKAIRLTAKMPVIVATFDRIRNGKGMVPDKAGLTLAERFLYQMKGELPIPEAKEAFDTALVLHADHGFNASTFTARVAISTRSDIYSAITAAIGTLKGPLHGGANEVVIAMLQDIGDLSRAESWIAEKLAVKERIFGFGHRVYRTMDPRASVLKAISKKLGEAVGQTFWYELSEKIEQIVKREKEISPNVDFYSASVYHLMGIPVDLFTPIFAISRIAGWTAHIFEQARNNRLIRPLSRYIGPENQQIVPIDQR